MKKLIPLTAAILSAIMTLPVMARDDGDPRPILDPIAAPVYEGVPASPSQTNIGVAIYRIDDNGVTRDILAYTGEFVANTTELVEFFHKQYPNIDEIVMNSPGGLAIEGLEMGNFLSREEFKVTVSPGTACLSACAFAFIGGRDYRIDGILGFHAAWITPPVNASAEELNGLFQQGQFAGIEFNMMFLQNGFNGYLASVITMTTDPDHMLVMRHESELLKWYVRDDVADQDDVIKYLSYPPVLEETPAVMTGEEIMEWVANNPTNNNRGRPVWERKVLWPKEPDQ